VTKRKWARTILVLAGISALAAIAWFTISYFPKASILARVLNPELAVTGDIADPEEYAIYSAIISSGFIDNSTELVVINSQTGLGLLHPADITNDRKPWRLEISDKAWNDFTAKRDLSSNLGNAFTLSKPYVLVDPNDMVDLNLELWEAHIHYTPFLEFSRVGFNSQKDEAIVHLGIAMLSRSKPAMMFAHGQYIWLKKLDNVWKIEKEQETYIT
jgi:hypothetical protein